MDVLCGLLFSFMTACYFSWLVVEMKDEKGRSLFEEDGK